MWIVLLGPIGSWVNKALETLVPLISNAEVDAAEREIHEVVGLILLAARKLAILHSELATRMAPVLDKQRPGSQHLSYIERRLELGDAFFAELASLPILK